MATGTLENLKRSSEMARHSLSDRFEHMKPQTASATAVWAVVGAVAVAAVVAATVYFSPDVIRYMKIRRM